MDHSTRKLWALIVPERRRSITIKAFFSGERATAFTLPLVVLLLGLFSRRFFLLMYSFNLLEVPFTYESHDVSDAGLPVTITLSNYIMQGIRLPLSFLILSFFYRLQVIYATCGMVGVGGFVRCIDRTFWNRVDQRIHFHYMKRVGVL